MPYTSYSSDYYTSAYLLYLEDSGQSSAEIQDNNTFDTSMYFENGPDFHESAPQTEPGEGSATGLTYYS